MAGGTNLTSGSTALELSLVFIALTLCTLIVLAFGVLEDSTPIRLTSTNDAMTVDGRALDKGAVFSLEGPWQMYWNRLMEPGDLAGEAPPRPDGALRFPGSWRGETLGNDRLGGTGVATFRLRLLLPPGNRDLTLRLFDLRVAYRLWVDGRLIAQSGAPGVDIASERPDRSLVLAPFKTPGGPVDLVLQLSNHRFRAGGVGSPVLLAKGGVLEAERNRGWVLASLLCGVLFMAGVYHLMLFVLRSKEVSFLYFGVYSLLLFGYAANSNSTDWLSRHILSSWVTTAAVDETSLICYAASGATLFRFYRSLYPEDFSRRLRFVSDLRLPAFVLSELLLPPVWRSWVIVILMATGLVFTAYYLARLSVCAWKRRSGGILLLCGAVLLASTSVHDVFVHSGAIEGNYCVLYGLFALVVFQSSALALRYARSFRTIEALSDDLGGHIKALEAEMSKRRELEREIVRVSEDERRRISHQLHDGLCQQLTAARLRYSMLTASAEARGAPVMSELGGLLSAAAEDAYALSRGLWPVEHDAAAAGPTLEELIGQAAETSGIPINLVREWPCGDCGSANLGVLHRIIQEAVTNAVKHAQATRIDVSLRCVDNGTICLEVADDGIGLTASHDTHAGGLGLRIMAHRAHAIGARLAIEAAPAGGTVVRCRARCARHGMDKA